MIPIEQEDEFYKMLTPLSTRKLRSIMRHLADSTDQIRQAWEQAYLDNPNAMECMPTPKTKEEYHVEAR